MRPALASERFLSAAHLRMIGAVAAEWSLLELVLRNEVRMLAGLPSIADTILVTAAANASALAHVAVSHLDAGKTGHLSQSAIAAFRKGLARVDKLTPLRNEVIHTMWLLSMLPGGSLEVFESQVGIAKGTHASRRGLADVAIKAVDMRALALEIQALREALQAKVDPGPSALLPRWEQLRKAAKAARLAK